MDTAAESGGKGRSPSVSTRFSLVVRTNKLTRQGTAEPASRNKLIRRERRQIVSFSSQLTTSRMGHYTVSIDTQSAEYDDHI